MIKSMTGFGRSEVPFAQGHIRVELKTVNHKFFEVSSRLPGHLMEFEDPIRKVISNEIRRGKISLFIASPDPAIFSTKLVLNEHLAKEVFHSIKRLREVLPMGGPSRLSKEDEAWVLREVLRTPDVLTRDSSSARTSAFFKTLEKALLLALKNLHLSRIREGAALARDLQNRLLEMEKALRVIQKRLPVLEREYKKNLKKKMKKFLPAGDGSASSGKDGQIDRERLTLEVAQYIKSSDISEEITRLKTHVDAMRAALKESGEVGRKIDFIAQEMTRESNTMGAKSGDVTIANAVIQIKSTIEKIREQASNVE